MSAVARRRRSKSSVRHGSTGADVRRHDDVAFQLREAVLHAFDEVGGDECVVLNDAAPLGGLVDGLPGASTGVPAILLRVPDDVVLGQTELLHQVRNELRALLVRHELDR